MAAARSAAVAGAPSAAGAADDPGGRDAAMWGDVLRGWQDAEEAEAEAAAAPTNGAAEEARNGEQQAIGAALEMASVARANSLEQGACP